MYNITVYTGCLKKVRYSKLSIFKIGKHNNMKIVDIIKYNFYLVLCEVPIQHVKGIMHNQVINVRKIIGLS